MDKNVTKVPIPAPPNPSLRLHNLCRESALLPDSGSINIKQIWNRNKCNCDKPQQTTRPWDSQVFEHRSDEQWENSSKYTPQKCICGNRTRRVLLECINQIVQRRLEYSEEPESHAKEPNTRCEPEDMAG